MKYQHIIIMMITATTSLLAGAGDTTAVLDSVFDRRWDDAAAPGGAVIIARGDTVVYERYSGMADMTTGEKIDVGTRFCIASVSKQFTVMALLQQAARWQGPLPLLDTPMSEFVDYRQPWWRDITPAMLCAHTSGLPDRRTGDRQWKIHAGDDESAAYFATLDAPVHGPGEYYDYLNPSFILLARIVGKLSGEEFVSYMNSHVFAPAGMKHTYYFDPARRAAGESHAYIPDGRGGWEEYDYGEETFFATRPDGGIYSTARDMLAWLGALRDGTVVGRNWVDISRQPRVSVTASPFCDYQRRPDTWYALGQYVEHPAGAPVKVFHTGDNGGYQAYVAVYPDSDTQIIVLENRNDRSRDALVETIDRILEMR